MLHVPTSRTRVHAETSAVASDFISALANAPSPPWEPCGGLFPWLPLLPKLNAGTS